MAVPSFDAVPGFHVKLACSALSCGRVSPRIRVQPHGADRPARGFVCFFLFFGTLLCLSTHLKSDPYRSLEGARQFWRIRLKVLSASRTAIQRLLVCVAFRVAIIPDHQSHRVYRSRQNTNKGIITVVLVVNHSSTRSVGVMRIPIRLSVRDTSLERIARTDQESKYAFPRVVIVKGCRLSCQVCSFRFFLPYSIDFHVFGTLQ